MTILSAWKLVKHSDSSVRHEQKLKTRLHLAITRLDEAVRERIQAIMAAHRAGLSIRKIAARPA